jgi:hypothetical protein
MENAVAQAKPQGSEFVYEPLAEAQRSKTPVYAVNLKGFKGMLSHFTQPGKMFADEISERLKVIACIEMAQHGALQKCLHRKLNRKILKYCSELLGAKKEDAQLFSGARPMISKQPLKPLKSAV